MSRVLDATDCTRDDINDVFSVTINGMFDREDSRRRMTFYGWARDDMFFANLAAARAARVSATCR